MNQHFKKRKARSFSAPVSPRRAAAAIQETVSCTTSTPTPSDHSHASSRAASPALLPTSTEGLNLSAALTALKVSLKRERDSFLPPTPAASPIHSRSVKRQRFEFGPILPDLNDGKQVSTTPSPSTPKASPVPKLRGSAFLSVSKKLQQELEHRARPDSTDYTLRARKRRQQLSYFAIASAFHRAAHERGLALVPATPVGE